MTLSNEEILKKAFKKARDNGWEQTFWYQWSEQAWEDYANNDEHLMWIFKHDFAKAFFGTKEHVCGSEECDAYYDWEWELQRMITEEEPLKYLEKFL